MDGAYVCSACGHRSRKWFGRCPGCHEWSTAADAEGAGSAPVAVSLADAGISSDQMSAGMGEVDRVLGGGLVLGGTVLLAGEPGIGKSTLALQLLDSAVATGLTALLVTGEESIGQVALRARRLGLRTADLHAVATADVGEVLAASGRLAPDVLLVDSVQSLADPAHDHPPGSVVQVRECASALARHAKRTGTVVVLVGHVTKEGAVAGPKTLEHLVDVVLTMEGERTGSLRLLRAIKNRYGSCEETGVFVMRERGLDPVADPSALLLSDRRPGISGSVVFPSLEGSRPMLVEVQALVESSDVSQPRRVALGVDPRRLALLLGILGRRAELKVARRDVFVAAAGGLAVREPASDLAVCLALRSAERDEPVDPMTVAFGEIGLGGEVRRVHGLERRLSEAARLGFGRAIVPRGGERAVTGIETHEVDDLAGASDLATRLVRSQEVRHPSRATLVPAPNGPFPE